MNQKKNFFIVKNRAMGDSIMGLSAVSYLRSLYPDAQIIYGVPEWVAPLFKNIKTDADLIYPLKTKNFKDFTLLFKDLIALNIDVIFEMHQAGRTGKFFKAFSILNAFRVKYYFHNHHLKSGTKVFEQGVIKSVIQRDLDGVYSYLNTDERLIPRFLDFPPRMNLRKITKAKNYDPLKIVLGVVATRETKKWGVDNFFSLMIYIRKHYLDSKRAGPIFIIPLSKSQNDEKLKAELLGFLEKSKQKNLFKIEQVELDLLPQIIDGSSLYIGNDTGLKHLAVALGIKTYTFFGPEPPNEWHPYSTIKHEFFFKDKLDCRTEKLHYCGLDTCSSMICLNEFTPKQAFLKIEKDLK